jgi:hypothetical protein
VQVGLFKDVAGNFEKDLHHHILSANNMPFLKALAMERGAQN